MAILPAMRAFCIAVLLLLPALARAQEAPLPELPVTGDRAGENGDAPAPGLGDLQAPSRPDTAPISPEALREARQYRECLALVETDPSAAVDMSFAWSAEGGALPARHCLALGLVEMEEYTLAADRLDEVAHGIRLGQGMPLARGREDRVDLLLAEIYGQIGNARILAGDPERAYTAFSQALADLPAGDEALRIELHVDRARALAGAGDAEAAIADLEIARRMGPERADIALYLAAALRATERFEAALDMATRAIELGGESAGALLERGNIEMMAGDPDAALRDWLAVAQTWPDSPAADAARANLEAAAIDPEAR